MIPINEIRIGNLFLNSQGNIQQITIEHFEYLGNPNFKPHDAINPIKLNIKIIEALGFKDATEGWGGSQGQEYVYKKGKFEIQTIDSDNLWHLSSDFSVKVEFVHQLQNLFFSHTSKEIKPVSIK
jgi:hypothetical protein